METASRDDFSIAIRSAFLKKGNKQKFSLLALIIASIALLFLESINEKSLNFVRSAIKDVIYRTSFIASIPGNTINPMLNTIQSHLKIYEQYELIQLELRKLKNQQNQIAYLKIENDKLKKTCYNFKPDLVVLGHADLISPDILAELKDEYPYLKIAQWFLDPLNKNGPDYDKNKNRILNKSKFVDANFITTSPEVLSFLPKNTTNFTFPTHLILLLKLLIIINIIVQMMFFLL